jgi:hypothetical protein
MGANLSKADGEFREPICGGPPFMAGAVSTVSGGRLSDAVAVEGVDPKDAVLYVDNSGVGRGVEFVRGAERRFEVIGVGKGGDFLVGAVGAGDRLDDGVLAVWVDSCDGALVVFVTFGLVVGADTAKGDPLLRPFFFGALDCLVALGAWFR